MSSTSGSDSTSLAVVRRRAARRWARLGGSCISETSLFAIAGETSVLVGSGTTGRGRGVGDLGENLIRN